MQHLGRLLGVGGIVGRAGAGVVHHQSPALRGLVVHIGGQHMGLGGAFRGHDLHALQHMVHRTGQRVDPANLFGLHTAYELDRIGGRYHLIEEERVRPRTVYQLTTDRLVDVFALRRRYGWLESVVDAEYGSAAYFPARDRIAIELRVSTTGLLFRPLTKAF